MTSIDRDCDVFGRLLRNVAVGGQDVGEAMISAGVAREYGSGDGVGAAEAPSAGEGLRSNREPARRAAKARPAGRRSRSRSTSLIYSVTIQIIRKWRRASSIAARLLGGQGFTF